MPSCLRIRKFLNVKKLPIICGTLALVTVVAIFGLNRTFVVVGRATYEQLQENAREYERIKEILNEKEKQEDELKRKLYTYCETQREPEVCKAVADSGVEVEQGTGFYGLAKFAVALGRSEQNYRCPVGSYNCFGIGAFDKYHYTRYDGYTSATLDLARLLKRFGYSSVTPEDIPAISRWYKGVPPYAHWIALIQEVMEEII